MLQFLGGAPRVHYIDYTMYDIAEISDYDILPIVLSFWYQPWMGNKLKQWLTKLQGEDIYVVCRTANCKVVILFRYSQDLSAADWWV